jgi:hypothetical protein
MGNNAVPFLVSEVFQSHRDSALRSNLHSFFLPMPRWAGRGSFWPHHQANQLATELLRDLRPPASALLAAVGPRLTSTRPSEFRQALYLLGSAGSEADLVLPHLISGLTNRADPLVSALAAQSLRWLGPAGSNAFPQVLQVLEDGSQNGSLAIWLAGLGPLARPAVPHLERLMMTATNQWSAIAAAFTLSHIEPDHSRAMALLRAALDNDSKTLPSTSVAGWSRMRESVLSVIWQGPHAAGHGLAAAVEALASNEVSRWTMTGASFQACLALDRIEPARALVLYQSALAGPRAGYAAYRILLLDRTNQAATQTLVSLYTNAVGPIQSDLALRGLGESSTLNTLAVDTLQQAATNGWTRRDQENAKAALARIKYREFKEASRLHAQP